MSEKEPLHEKPCAYCKISTKGMPDGFGNHCWVCFREPCLDKFDEYLDLKSRSRTETEKLTA